MSINHQYFHGKGQNCNIVLYYCTIDCAVKFTFEAFVVLRINSLFVFGTPVTEYTERRNYIIFNSADFIAAIRMIFNVYLLQVKSIGSKLRNKIFESDWINVPKSNSDILRLKQEP